MIRRRNPNMKKLSLSNKILVGVLSLMFVFGIGSNIARADRTDGNWTIGSDGTYVYPNANMYNVLIGGTNRYLNFGGVSGSVGYGIRDNGGNIEFKNSGGMWAGIGSGSGAVSSVFGRTGAVVATSGDYTTALVPESGNLYFTNARAIAATLTGYTSGAGSISSSDSILSAIQKLNGNIGALTTGVSSVSNSDGTLTISPTTGAVVSSLNLGNANTWTALETFNAGLTDHKSSGQVNLNTNGIDTTANSYLSFANAAGSTKYWQISSGASNADDLAIYRGGNISVGGIFYASHNNGTGFTAINADSQGDIRSVQNIRISTGGTVGIDTNADSATTLGVNGSMASESGNGGITNINYSGGLGASGYVAMSNTNGSMGIKFHNDNTSGDTQTIRSGISGNPDIGIQAQTDVNVNQGMEFYGSGTKSGTTSNFTCIGYSQQSDFRTYNRNGFCNIDSTGQNQAYGALSIGPTVSANPWVGFTPKGWLTLAAGTATIPEMTLTAGTNETTPAAGDVEYDGTNLYETNSTASRGTITVNRTITSSAATLTLATTSTDYVFTGTAATWTLPPVAGNTNFRFFIKNKGSAVVTLSSNAGANDIYGTTAASTFPVTAGQGWIIYDDGTNWDME